MNPIEFQKKWLVNTTKERSASQSHFNDLCALVNHPTPLDLDPTGEFFTFERGASKLRGSQGWADVWYRGKFAVEYKGRGKDLKAAYDQLAQYREDLESPPLLIVSDLDRIEIHTNFTGTVKQVHHIDLSTITEPESLRLLRAAFYEPDTLKPSQTVQAVTEQASRHFGTLALGLRERGHDPHESAHFLMQLLFCLFAEDIGILKNGIFSKVVAFGSQYPARFNEQISGLLTSMAEGGFFNMEAIPHVNGGLFSRVKAFDLTQEEIRTLAESASMDWSSIEPAIFGTLFERSLDPGKRAQLGAHYTGRPDIERVVEPVVMVPLRREWEAVRAEMDAQRHTVEAAKTTQTRRNAEAKLATIQSNFLHRLAEVKILDPACGSGNFLYIALERLLALEKEVIMYGAESGLSIALPGVNPAQLLGMEIDPLARELAQVAIWIGYLQWMIGNGFGWSEPVLQPLETIRLQDALLTSNLRSPISETIVQSSPHDTSSSRVVIPDFSPSPSAPLSESPTSYTETVWPAAEFIIGNPPFLGGKMMIGDMGEDYVETLRGIYDNRLPRFSDLCCYFFEKARAQIDRGDAERAGLLATNSIRGGANRVVLDRIKQSGDIFMAWSDEPWVLNGAAVRISIIGFDSGIEMDRLLDGAIVPQIHSNLSAQTNVTKAVKLRENQEIAFIGVQPSGAFDVPGDTARNLITQPRNANGNFNSDVLRPYVNAMDIVRRPSDRWIIDFGSATTEAEAALYELPYEHVSDVVKPVRLQNKERIAREYWWIHWRSRPEMRNALSGIDRYIGTPLVSKHRAFVWLKKQVLASNLVVVFARDDDYFFGVLHSRAHEVWSLRMGTWLGKGNDPRYTPTTCFETFPFPWAPGTEPTDSPRVIAIGEAAAELDRLRRNWLDPEGATEAELKKRTLTNLYNARPTWLQHAHATLDRAVWAAYGWGDPDPAAVEEDTILARLLALNLERAGLT